MEDDVDLPFCLLFECENSKRTIKCSCTTSNLPSILERELKKIVGDSAKLVLDITQHTSTTGYLLQRYSIEWKDYVDVVDPNDILTRDKLRVVELASKESDVSLLDYITTSNYKFILVKEESFKHIV